MKNNYLKLNTKRIDIIFYKLKNKNIYVIFINKILFLFFIYLKK